jgi:hypothetical protein
MERARRSAGDQRSRARPAGLSISAGELLVVGDQAGDPSSERE